MEITGSAKRKLVQSIKGDVFFDELTRRIYAYSASICYLMPAAVIYPLDKDDVISTVRIAAEEGIPITARGSGSGVAGQNLGEGIVLDFSVHMKRILYIDEKKRTVLLEPGLIRTKLIKSLEHKHLFFPPDPSSSDYATIGGMVANNAGGAHSLLYGTTKNYVKKLSMITSDAEEIVVTNNGEAPLKYQAQIENLLQDALQISDKYAPKSYRSSCGYNLFEALKDNRKVDFTKIFCGSEGTLGIFTSIELELAKIPPYRSSLLLYYRDALAAFAEIKNFLDLNPSTVQALADEFLQLIAKMDPQKYARFPKGTDLILLIEFDGNDLEDLGKKAHELIKRSSAFEFQFAEHSSELAWIWEIRRSAAGYLSRIPGDKPTRWIEDAAIPVDKLPNFVLGLNNLLKKYKTSAALFGHAGQGLLHFSPRLNRMSPDFYKIIEKLGHEHALFAKELKGVPSGEHGDGLLRTPYLKEFWGEFYSYFEKLKRIFDPHFRFNPLSIVSQRKYKVREFLRFNKGYNHKDSGALNQLINDIEACHGCGKCRNFCPVTRSVAEEIGSSRARINLLREIISGHLKEPFERIDLLKFFNLCLHCKTCLMDCPTGLDIAKIIEVYFEERYMHKPASIPDKILSKTRQLSELAIKTGILSKIVMSSSFFRKISGLVGLGNFEYLTFDPLKPKQLAINLKTDGKRAVIFSGCTGDFLNPYEIKATLKLLKKFGYSVGLISSYCCGEPAFARGFKIHGKEKLKESIESLKEYIETETPVIFTSPSCMLPFFEHSEGLLGEVETKKMEKCLYEGVNFIMEQILKLKDNFRTEAQIEHFTKSLFNSIDLRVAVQIPCHLRVLRGNNSLIKFLKILPVADVVELKTKCCGFGGSRGFEKKWIDHADKIGEALVEEILAVKANLIVSPCVTCRLQIKKILGEKALLAESIDIQNFIFPGKSRDSNKTLIVHPLVLASEMLK